MVERDGQGFGAIPVPRAIVLDAVAIVPRQITPPTTPAAINLAISIPTRPVLMPGPISSLRATQEPQMPFPTRDLMSTLPAGTPVAPPAPTAIANTTAVVAELATPKATDSTPPTATQGIPQQRWAVPHETLSRGGAEDGVKDDPSAPEKPPEKQGGGAGLGLAALAAWFFFR